MDTPGNFTYVEEGRREGGAGDTGVGAPLQTMLGNSEDSGENKNPALANGSSVCEAAGTLYILLLEMQSDTDSLEKMA